MINRKRQITFYRFEIFTRKLEAASDGRYDMVEQLLMEAVDSRLNEKEARSLLRQAGIKLPYGSDVFVRKQEPHVYEFDTDELMKIAVEKEG